MRVIDDGVVRTSTGTGLPSMRSAPPLFDSACLTSLETWFAEVPAISSLSTSLASCVVVVTGTVVLVVVGNCADDLVVVTVVVRRFGNVVVVI